MGYCIWVVNHGREKFVSEIRRNASKEFSKKEGSKRENMIPLLIATELKMITTMRCEPNHYNLMP